MSTSTPAVRTERLCLAREGQRLLRNIDFEISTGECLAITGNNGAGKTTFLRCLAGLARPTSGTVWWFGQPASARFADRRQIGLVAHECHLYDQLSVRENLVFVARMHSVADAAHQVDCWLDRIGLGSVANRQVRAISRGMRRRLALGRAMIHNPRILLLDEPFSGLDGDGQQWLVAQMRELRSRETAVCMVIHDHYWAEQVADRTCLLEEGTFRVQRDGEWTRSCDQPVAA